ncbi:MAG: Lacal_2735 family protein [Bacteroidetes bacterium]|nr:MAG: Lacal_2735 family protein [Bacteroidota bacterium]
MKLFRRKSDLEKLETKYMQLLSKAKELSTVNRKESDRLIAEAEKISTEIAALLKR